MSKQIRTIEDAMDILKVQIFDRLENGDNSLADIETIARVVNSIAMTQEHVALTRQTERYENAEPIPLGAGITLNKSRAFYDAPQNELGLDKTVNP